MPKIYSYIITHDAGAAPNPFWGICTLAICKPAIRRTAEIGDWIIATGSKNAKCNDLAVHDLSGSLVYAMKVTKILTFEEYDELCRSIKPKKIPNWRTKRWKDKVGDSIFSFKNNERPILRMSVHNEGNRTRDLGGLNVLLSNHFYYFGEEARPIPSILQSLIKKNQGHLIVRDETLIRNFEKWLLQFKKNKIYADPQERWAFDRHMSPGNKAKCL